MKTQDEVLNQLSQALEWVPAYAESDILYMEQENGLTRFTESAIHQNMLTTNAHVAVRVVMGKKVGVAVTNSITDEALKQAVDSAEDIARNQQPSKHLPPLPKPSPIEVVDTYDEQTASFTPEMKASVLKGLFNKASRKNSTLSGAFATLTGAIAVANSNGVRLHQPVTTTDLAVLAFSGNGSGYGYGASRQIGELEFDPIAETAITKAVASKDSREVPPGEYDVLLEPQAVADLLAWLNYIGFGAKEYQEGTSFLSDKMGETVVGENITILDDALDCRGYCFPFDLEGVPKQKVTIIDKGVAAAVVYDRHTAARDDCRSTGHSMGPEHPNNPMAANLILSPGSTSLEEMTSGMDRGLLVTRFHYINGFLDTRNAVLTGMTRDGTFLVEGGRVKYGVRNLRFADSMVRALSNVLAVSREYETVLGGFEAIGASVCPALLIKGFKFTSVSDH